ncbi:hypothetical protein P7K49_029227, partial [Saguinus oedipus]
AAVGEAAPCRPEAASLPGPRPSSQGPAPEASRRRAQSPGAAGRRAPPLPPPPLADSPPTTLQRLPASGPRPLPGLAPRSSSLPRPCFTDKVPLTA